MVDSHIILIKVEKMRKETCEIHFFVVEIPRFVLSATRFLDLGKNSPKVEFCQHICC
jgi:hypothetical protein